MTLTVEERERVRRALDVYAAEAPPAPDWGSWETALVRRPQRRLTGPLVAVATALLVIVMFGVPAFLGWVGSDTATSDTHTVETWGDWYEWVASRGELNGRDPTIVQGQLGPEPLFDPSISGIEQALVPVSQVGGDVPWSRFEEFVTDRETLVVAGRAESSVAAVVGGVFEEGRVVTDGVCLVVARPVISGDWDSAGTCRDRTGPVAYGDAPLLWLALRTDRLSVAVAVPPQTSVVTIQSGSQQYWQRPRGGLSLFVGDFTAEIRFTFYAQSGEVLARWSSQP